MNLKHSWQPSPHDVRWVAALISGGPAPRTLWGIPDNRAIYEIDREARRFTLIYGPECSSSGINLFQRTGLILARLGWNMQKVPVPMTDAEANAFFEKQAVGPEQPVVTLEMHERIFGKGKIREQH